MVNNTKNGFTLAEVLITLVIIGIVAALTIPTAINNYRKQEYVAGLKKAYSVLSQSLYKMGQNKGYPIGDYSFLKDINFINEFSKVVSVVTKDNSISGCFGEDYETKYTTLDKSQNGLGDNNSSQCCITADGMIYGYRSTSVSNVSLQHGLSAQDASNTFAWIAVDVNGEKGPNVWGRDLFLFDVTATKGILPAGNESSANCKMSSTGFVCTAKVLKENAINY